MSFGPSPIKGKKTQQHNPFKLHNNYLVYYKSPVSNRVSSIQSQKHRVSSISKVLHNKIPNKSSIIKSLKHNSSKMKSSSLQLTRQSWQQHQFPFPNNGLKPYGRLPLIPFIILQIKLAKLVYFTSNENMGSH